MKKIFLFILIGLFAGSLFAQELGAEQKNAGNAALRAKNYTEAFRKYEEYLKIIGNKDDATVYNTAICATKIKNYVAAEKYFDMSIKNKYKTASSYLGKAQAQKSQNKNADMLVTLQAGIKAFPGNMSLETMYATYYLKEGRTFQQSGNMTKAEENYLKITALSDKNFRAQGYVSLGTLYYNNGAKILGDAAGLANTDQTRYNAEKTRAQADFMKAKDYLTQAKSLDPTNEDAKERMVQVEAAMK